jgi:hypothetical protein
MSALREGFCYGISCPSNNLFLRDRGGKPMILLPETRNRGREFAANSRVQDIDG